MCVVLLGVTEGELRPGEGVIEGGESERVRGGGEGECRSK